MIIKFVYLTLNLNKAHEQCAEKIKPIVGEFVLNIFYNGSKHSLGGGLDKPSFIIDWLSISFVTRGQSNNEKTRTQIFGEIIWVALFLRRSFGTLYVVGFINFLNFLIKWNES